MATSVNDLKLFFETGDMPTQDQFYQLIEAFRHKNTPLVTGDITGLSAAMAENPINPATVQVASGEATVIINLALGNLFHATVANPITNIVFQNVGNVRLVQLELNGNPGAITFPAGFNLLPGYDTSSAVIILNMYRNAAGVWQVVTSAIEGVEESGGGAWGEITGTLADQTDLSAALAAKAASVHTHATADVTGLDAALAGKAATSHNHDASAINAGLLPMARGGTGIGFLTNNFVPVILSGAFASSAMIYVVSGNKLGLGNAATLSNDIRAPLTIIDSGAAAAKVLIIGSAAASSSSGGIVSIFVKALPTASGHRLGMIVMGSQNGDASQENNAASIEAFSGAAWSAASSHSSYIIFSTTSIGATSRTERMRIAENGNVGIGAAPNASALLDVSSTTKGLLVPRMTSGQKTGISSPANGLIVYDTDLNHLCIYNGTAWRWLGARAFTPANTADAAGSVGDMAFDNSYTYTKTAAGWARAALSTF